MPSQVTHFLAFALPFAPDLLAYQYARKGIIAFENVFLPLTDATLNFFFRIHLYCFSIVEFFECNVVWNHGVLSLVPSSKRPSRISKVEAKRCRTPTEKLSKNIAHVWAILRTTRASKALHTIRIIHFPSIRVIQDLISKGDVNTKEGESRLRGIRGSQLLKILNGIWIIGVLEKGQTGEIMDSTEGGVYLVLRCDIWQSPAKHVINHESGHKARVSIPGEGS